MEPKKRRKRIPKPRRYRDGWIAQVTLNGRRPARVFERYVDAENWIADMLASKAGALDERPGGPDETTLALALRHYAFEQTVIKGGVRAELNRINHYLERAGLPLLSLERANEGQLSLVERPISALPKAFRAYQLARLGRRAETYKAIGELTTKRCSAITRSDIRHLMTTMKREGLSDSTVQKEVALLRGMFNAAIDEWGWTDFRNPAQKMRLGHSNRRFVVLTAEQQAALWQAVLACDNPLFPALVAFARETTMRRKSLLELSWHQVDLAARIAKVGSKTGVIRVPLSRSAIAILAFLKERPSQSGRVFPMTVTAVEMAWRGVRKKAGLPELQFRDLRHLGATDYARAGLSVHALKEVLGHTSTHMAEVYVNLVANDVLRDMDAAAARMPSFAVPAPPAGDAQLAMNARRAARFGAAAHRRAAQKKAEAAQAPVDSSWARSFDNVIAFPASPPQRPE